jgi:hypothetical protein
MVTVVFAKKRVASDREVGREWWQRGVIVVTHDRLF